MSAVLWALDHLPALLVVSFGGALLAALAVAAIGRDDEAEDSNR